LCPGEAFTGLAENLQRANIVAYLFKMQYLTTICIDQAKPAVHFACPFEAPFSYSA